MKYIQEHILPVLNNWDTSFEHVALVCLPYVPAVIALAFSASVGIPLFASAALFTLATPSK